MTLVDGRTGLVRLTRTQPMPPEFPPTLHAVESLVADASRWSPWPSDPTCAGGVFWDRSAAEAAALGEAAERYSGNLVPPGMRSASYEDLRARGQAGIDPEALVLYSAEQYQQDGFPFVPFSRDLAVRWVESRDLQTRSPVLVPASLVWCTYFRSPPGSSEPWTNGVLYAGIAAGPTRAAAERSALLELLERDSVTLSWTSGGSTEEVIPAAWLATLARGPKSQFVTRFVRFPSLVGPPVLGALVTHESTEYVTLGTACRPDPVAAAMKALAEAFQLQLVARQLDDPASALCRLARTRDCPLKSWREDRHYRAAYRADLRDMTDLACNLQLHLDLSVWPPLDPELGAGGRVQMSDIAPDEADTATITARLADLGVSVVSVDVTTDDVRSLGMHVVRLVSPGLYSNAPAATPFLGGTRLAAAMAGTGRRPRLEPLPYA